MPRPRKQTDLESRINEIVLSASRQIAAMVRRDFAEQVGQLIAPPRADGRQAAVAKAAPRGRGRRSSLNDATLDRVLKVIEGSPGLRSEEIYKKVPLPVKKVKAALAKLRETKRVKTKGEKRAMTYAA